MNLKNKQPTFNIYYHLSIKVMYKSFYVNIYLIIQSLDPISKTVPISY